MRTKTVSLTNLRYSSDFRRLSRSDKERFILENNLDEYIIHSQDIDLIIDLLIETSYPFRLQILSQINTNIFNEEELTLLDFLKTENYHDFKNERFDLIKKHLIYVLHKLSDEQLRYIITSNYERDLNSIAFTIYCRNSKLVRISKGIGSNISSTLFATELKRRKRHGKKTIIDYDEFIQLSKQVQNHIINNYDMKEITSSIIDSKKDIGDNASHLFLDGVRIITHSVDFVSLVDLQVILHKLDDEKARELVKLFFKNVLKFNFEVEDKYVDAMLFTFRKLEERTTDILQLIKCNPYAVINYLNTGKIEESWYPGNYINIDQYQKVNLKKLNKLVKLLNSLDNNECNDDEEYIKLAYKIYFTLGFDLSFELLSNKFGEVKYLLINEMFKGMNILDIELNKIGTSYEPVINQRFINFILSSKKDNNAVLRRILNGELSEVKDNLSYIYNNFSKIEKDLGGKVHLNKLLVSLRKNPYILQPNEYQLTKEFIDIIIRSSRYGKSKKHISLNDDNENKAAVLKACAFYHNYIKKRVSSSIPRVCGKTINNYTYEVLRLDDPTILTIGYLTSSCFRIGGDSETYLQFCCENEDARVIVIRNSRNEICGAVPIFRDGNIIVGNSIEKSKNADDQETYRAVKCAYDDIINASKVMEDEPIVAGLVTDLHKNVFTNRRIASGTYSIVFPFYTNYSQPLFIVSSDEGIDISDFRSYKPTPVYLDERPKVLVNDMHLCTRQERETLMRRVQSIKYTINQENTKHYSYFDNYISGEDWYLGYNFHSVDGQVIEKDPRAIDEYQKAMEIIKSQIDLGVYRITVSKNDLDKISSRKRIITRESNN